MFHVPDNLGIKLSGVPLSPHAALRAAILLRALTDPVTSSSSLSGLNIPSLPAVHPLLLSDIASSTSTLRRLYLAAALTPYHNLTYTQTKGKVRPAAEAVIREGLKLGVQHHYLDGIPALVSTAEILQKCVSDWEAGKMDKPERAWIGVLLREKNVHNPVSGSHWASSLLFALSQELATLWSDGAASIDGENVLSPCARSPGSTLIFYITVETASSRIAAYNRFAARIEELGLPAAVDAKPIVDVRFRYCSSLARRHGGSQRSADRRARPRSCGESTWRRPRVLVCTRSRDSTEKIKLLISH